MKYNNVFPGDINTYFEIRNDDGMIIGTASMNDSPFDGCKPVTLNDTENNARLWTAAPELLEALQWFIDNYEPEKAFHREYFDKAKQAINKARNV